MTDDEANTLPKFTLPDSGPLPGSYEAVQLGCSCPQIDNHYGLGRYGTGLEYGWIVDENCPVHSPPTPARSTQEDQP